MSLKEFLESLVSVIIVLSEDLIYIGAPVDELSVTLLSIRCTFSVSGAFTII